MIKKIGLIINPYAGLGGKVGLKGSDGIEIVKRALSLGAIPQAEIRTLKALENLKNKNIINFYTSSGNMGENICKKLNINYNIIYNPESPFTCTNDTRNIAQKLLDNQVDLILFSGGDGTARDIQYIIKDQIPILGIPCGVKMYSGVFAMNLNQIKILIDIFIQKNNIIYKESEILDIDEAYLRAGYPATKLFGYAKTFSNSVIQSAKGNKKTTDENMLDAICFDNSKYLFERGIINIVGPGSTMKKITDYARIDGTLLGVDIIKEGKIIKKDANENQILSLIKNYKARIFIGVIGGTGCLFGRGNQQISAEVINIVGKENIKVISSMDKILSLEHKSFFVDTGNSHIDKKLSGFIRVQVEKNNFMLVPVRN